MRKVLALLLLAAPVGVAHAQATAKAAPAMKVKAAPAAKAQVATTVKVKEETPGLLKTAKVTPEAATKTAEARVPTGHIRSAEIEKEDGKLIYSFDMAVPKQAGVQEVNVDAMSGEVVATEHESASAEKHEKARNEKHVAAHKSTKAG